MNDIFYLPFNGPDIDLRLEKSRRSYYLLNDLIGMLLFVVGGSRGYEYV